MAMFLKIGELAKRTGLSVRALHHYDAIGLLSPLARTQSGSRRYGPQELVRLHRIQALKQLGYSLADIQLALDGGEPDPREILERQIGMLDARARQAQALSDALRELADRIAAGGQAAATDWLDLLEMMALHQKHLTEAEMRSLRRTGDSGNAQVQGQLAALVAEVGRAVALQMPADSTYAQALSWRWVRLVIAMTGNDAALANKLKTMQEQEPRAQAIAGISQAMLDWVGQAVAHARTALLARHLAPMDVAQVRQRQLATMSHMQAWPALVAQVRQQMDAGAPASAPQTQALMKRWQQLFRDTYCGDDPAMEVRVRTAFDKEPELMVGVGVDPALLAYVRLAKAGLKAV